ncbi:MAG: tetratricopeptide repeat protein [Emcibacter sp.]|nr:tetratricopeptide repeat protein [Emcibacter sp.]
MYSKLKFINLLLMLILLPSLALYFFLQTDYAIRERAYFHDYPYQKITKKALPTVTVHVMTETPSALISSPKKSINPVKSIQIEPLAKIQDDFNTPYSKPVVIPPVKAIVIAKKQKTTAITHPKISQENSTPDIKNDIITDKHNEAELGYLVYEKGDFEKAIQYFETALKQSPHNSAMREQLSYAYKKSGHNKKAVESFKITIDQYLEKNDGKVPFSLRREVEQLENRLEFNSYAIYRDQSSHAQNLSGADLTQSQAGMEFVYQPENIGFNNGRKFQVYGRLLSSMQADQFNPNPKSYQAGLGLRLKPFSEHNFIISAERLIKVGDYARNDWMVRMGYSLDHGTDYQEHKTSWWSYSLYLDAALINPTSHPDILLTSQVVSGYNIPLTAGIILQPRLTGLATWQKDIFHKTSLIEMGPGVNIRTYFHETKYEAYRSYIDITAEYRLKISGNSIGGSGPILSLILHF